MKKNNNYGEKYNKYDLLKCELFELLLPRLFYTDTKDGQEDFMEVLEAETENVAYELFKRMCKEDGVECPYDENDFYIEKVTLAGLHFVCISIPESSPCVSYALRVYFVTVCERENPEKKHTRYFYIKKFREIEKVHVMYVSPKEELILGTELTDRADDRAYERCAIAKHFMRVLIDEKIIGIDAESDEM